MISSVKSSDSQYVSKIIKAGALLSDTKIFLANWDSALTQKENLEKFREENVFGKASRSRIEDILRIFKQRYLVDPAVCDALVNLVGGNLDSQSLDRILFFHAAKSDKLLHDTVIEFLYPRNQRGRNEIIIDDLQRQLMQWVKEKKTTAEWSEPTARRVAQGLLSTLRDFGVLEGATKKRIAPVYLTVQAFSYIAFIQSQVQSSGHKVLHDPIWQLFFMSTDGVERFFFEAHQYGLLDYHAAGNVIRIDFPSSTLPEYANVVVKRSA